MLDKPKLLKGLDMNNLSSSELPLEDLCIPRDQEIQSILTSYQQCMSGSLEVVVVKGESGAGKSILAQCVASSLISNGGLVLMGKFDQMQQSRPFSALASALDQYLDVLISQLGSDWAGIVVHRLQMTLGKDASFLIKVLPKLGLILGNTASCQSPDFDNNFGNAVQRIQYLLCQFVEVISTTSIVSVTLCLDDVQWVDEASISVLDRVLSQARQKFFFLACCRDNEMSNDHPFWKVIESARGNSIASKQSSSRIRKRMSSTQLYQTCCVYHHVLQSRYQG
jgi:predicted ATPase